MQEADRARWLLLIHQIPPKPNYLRVKIWRRLQRVGAVAIKNSVYALPRTIKLRKTSNGYSGRLSKAAAMARYVKRV